jgi:hypothetical protein
VRCSHDQVIVEDQVEPASGLIHGFRGYNVLAARAVIAGGMVMGQDQAFSPQFHGTPKEMAKASLDPGSRSAADLFAFQVAMIAIDEDGIEALMVALAQMDLQVTLQARIPQAHLSRPEIFPEAGFYQRTGGIDQGANIAVFPAGFVQLAARSCNDAGRTAETRNQALGYPLGSIACKRREEILQDL